MTTEAVHSPATEESVQQFNLKEDNELRFEVLLDLKYTWISILLNIRKQMNRRKPPKKFINLAIC